MVTIMAFSICTEEEARRIQPRVIILNEKNEIALRKGGGFRQDEESAE